MTIGDWLNQIEATGYYLEGLRFVSSVCPQMLGDGCGCVREKREGEWTYTPCERHLNEIVEEMQKPLPSPNGPDKLWGET